MLQQAVVPFDFHLVSASASLGQPQASRVQQVPQEGQSLRILIHTEGFEFLQQSLTDKIIEPPTGLHERCFVIVPQHHVIHIAHIGRQAQRFPGIVVSWCEIMISKVLTGEVADGQATTGQYSVTVDDAVKNAEQERIFEQTAQLAAYDTVMYAVKILAHIELQVPSMAAVEFPRPFQCGISPLTFATGIAVKNLLSLKKRVTDVHKCMVQHPLREGSSTYLSLLGVVDRKIMIAADVNFSRQDLRLQSPEIIAQSTAKGQNLRLGSFPPLCLVPCQLKVSYVCNLLNQVSRSFHLWLPG